jgi:adenosylcobinamide-phosphate guanylyltransferase
MIDRVLDALRSCPQIGTVYASVSVNAPITREHLVSKGVHVIETSGTGYVTDLNSAMNALGARTVLVCPADMPLLTGEAIKNVILNYASSGVESMSVAVPASTVRSLGVVPSYKIEVEGQDVVLCGVSVVDRRRMLTEETLTQGFMVTNDQHLALNVNTRDELEWAEKWLIAHGKR